MSPRKPSAEPAELAEPTELATATRATRMRAPETQATATRAVVTRATTARSRPRTGAGRGASGADGPSLLDRYRLIRRLGSGAFGTVWMAHDEHLGRDVAVKILAPERIVSGRFQREARAAARLAHPGIVTLYEAAVDEEGAYLVSQLVLGDTLDALLQEGCLSDRDIVAVGIALCDALEHAHAHGIVHRDVKPSNVLIPEAPSNAAEVAKLTDFGVARLVDSDGLTLTGDVVGTVAYMAPEQADGLEVGPSADLYALALVLYEALTGVNPIARGVRLNPSRRLGAHLPPVRRQRRDLPRVLGQGLDLALRPRPAERGTIAELRWALVQARDEVSDEPGVVGEPWSPLTQMTSARREDGPDPGWHRDAPDDEDDGARAPVSRSILRRRVPWPERAAGALGAAGLVAWLATVLHPAAVAPAPAALATAAAILLLPRISWLALVVTAGVMAAAAGQPGLAALLAGSLLLAPVLLPSAPGLWGAAAAAPALGLLGVGLAGAWPAVAGRFWTPWRRAGLAALGWLWLLAASALTGRGLLAPQPLGTPGPARLEHSATALIHGLVIPAGRDGAWIPGAVWAIGAIVAPWLIDRAPTVRAHVLRALVWSVAVGVAPAAALTLIAGPAHAPGPSAVPVGVLACLAVILGPLVLPRGLTRLVRGSENPILP